MEEWERIVKEVGGSYSLEALLIEQAVDIMEKLSDKKTTLKEALDSMERQGHTGETWDAIMWNYLVNFADRGPDLCIASEGIRIKPNDLVYLLKKKYDNYRRNRNKKS